MTARCVVSAPSCQASKTVYCTMIGTGYKKLYSVPLGKAGHVRRLRHGVHVAVLPAPLLLQGISAVTEDLHRSELLGNSSGKRAGRAQPEAESAFSALFGGSKAHSKLSQDASLSQEHDAAHLAEVRSKATALCKSAVLTHLSPGKAYASKL